MNEKIEIPRINMSIIENLDNIYEYARGSTLTTTSDRSIASLVSLHIKV